MEEQRMVVESSEILLLLTGLVFSAIFSGSEAVVMSFHLDRIKQIIEEGGRKGRAFEFVLKKPSELLTTILVGNNFVNIYVAALATSIATRLFDDAIAISVGGTTFAILIVGEIVPKTIARSKAEFLGYPTVLFLRFIYRLLIFIVFPLSYMIQKVFGKNARLNGRVITDDDIEFMVNQAGKENSIDSKQVDLLNSILEFPKIRVKDIMVPRNKIYAFEKSANFKDVLELVREVAHSRYPVYNEDLDNVLGFLHVKDLAFVGAGEDQNFDIESFLKEPFFVFENMKINAVFDHMNRNKVHLALVKDENNVIVGMITLEDIMEEIFGEIQDEHDTEDDGIPRVDQPLESEGLVVPGIISLRDLASEYDIKIPLNDNYSTLIGFILEMIENNFPKEGQVILWENYSFELTKVIGSNIEEVTVKSIENDSKIEYSDEVIKQEKEESTGVFKDSKEITSS